ncbi:hypothetical protein [Hungatella hathewayi]
MKFNLLREEWCICALIVLGLLMIPTGVLPVQLLGLGLTSPFALLMAKMYFAHAQAERMTKLLPSYAHQIGSTICRAFDLNFCNRINIAVPRLVTTTEVKYYSLNGNVILANVPISVATVLNGRNHQSRNLLPMMESQLRVHWQDQWGPANLCLVLESVDIQYLHNQQMYLLKIKVRV